LDINNKEKDNFNYCFKHTGDGSNGMQCIGRLVSIQFIFTKWIFIRRIVVGYGFIIRLIESGIGQWNAGDRALGIAIGGRNVKAGRHFQCSDCPASDPAFASLAVVAAN